MSGDYGLDAKRGLCGVARYNGATVTEVNNCQVYKEHVAGWYGGLAAHIVIDSVAGHIKGAFVALLNERSDNDGVTYYVNEFGHICYSTMSIARVRDAIEIAQKFGFIKE